MLVRARVVDRVELARRVLHEVDRGQRVRARRFARADEREVRILCT